MSEERVTKCSSSAGGPPRGYCSVQMIFSINTFVCERAKNRLFCHISHNTMSIEWKNWIPDQRTLSSACTLTGTGLLSAGIGLGSYGCGRHLYIERQVLLHKAIVNEKRTKYYRLLRNAGFSKGAAGCALLIVGDYLCRKE